MRVLTAEKKKKKTKKNKKQTNKKQSFWRYRKTVAKTFNDPDPLFPNYLSFGFHDNNQMGGSFAENSYILLRNTYENVLVTFCWTYWIVWLKSPFFMVIFHYVYFLFWLPWQQKFKINLVNKKSFESYCVWMLYVKFCKILYPVFITIFRNYCIWWGGWGNVLLYYQKFFRSHVPYCVQE